VAVIAANEARAEERATPVWAAGAAVFAGIASFTEWALWSWADFGFAAPIWVGSSILMCLWLLWFGIGLVRAETVHAVSPGDLRDSAIPGSTSRPAQSRSGRGCGAVNGMGGA